MTRLFVAIDPPLPLCTLLSEMAGDIRGARPVPLEQLHLTLKFIGDVQEARLPGLKEALKAITHQPFYLTIKGFGRFPHSGNPRIVWAGIVPQPELGRLYFSIEQTLARHDIAREARAFTPHITLARCKTSKPEQIRPFLEKHRSFHSEPFLVEQFNLYRSTLTADGAIHTLEETVFLRQA